MTSFWNLEFCDIFRDGGSLGAVISQGTKRVSLFLEVVPWERPDEPRRYRSLWVSDGEIPDRWGEEVPARSESEREWLARLQNDVSAEAADDNCRVHFRELIAALHDRNRGRST